MSIKKMRFVFSNDNAFTCNNFPAELAYLNYNSAT
ncbi:Uncharacterised protein [Klebsiella pneumoniae]|nr:Uncharacterised protein [Klebsiella pneumoniae]